MANGVKESLIDLRNPEIDALSDIKSQDYVFSFISCGFHYPWDTYLDFYKQALAANGRVILDVRTGRFAEALPGVSELGFAKYLTKAANGKADRVMLARQP